MQWSAPRVGSRAMTDRSAALEIANQYRRAMPDRIRRYLNRRGIPDTVIELHLVGWNGERITIPIRDGDPLAVPADQVKLDHGERITIPIRDAGGRVLFFRLAKDPDDKGPGPKMLAPLGSAVALYGWERLRVKPPRIIICEGEYLRPRPFVVRILGQLEEEHPSHGIADRDGD